MCSAFPTAPGSGRGRSTCSARCAPCGRGGRTCAWGRARRWPRSRPRRCRAFPARAPTAPARRRCSRRSRACTTRRTCSAAASRCMLRRGIQSVHRARGTCHAERGDGGVVCRASARCLAGGRRALLLAHASGVTALDRRAPPNDRAISPAVQRLRGRTMTAAATHARRELARHYKQEGPALVRRKGRARSPVGSLARRVRAARRCLLLKSGPDA